MKLSELHTGERAYVVKVLGHGGFRKRIIEMGFIKGQSVETLLNAPLRDPIKYKIMGYEVSMRRSEADQIEVITLAEAASLLRDASEPLPALQGTEEQGHLAVQEKRRTINVALVGNPNCGKTSLFNFASGAHEHVGNYSGVTVDAKLGYAEFEGYRFNIVDLPGTYSLSAYSPEELYVRKQIVEQSPDVIINVIDSSNLERNLYLTTQLMDMHLRMVCALNMYDEFQRRGDSLNLPVLEQLLGVPMVPTSFKTGKGLEALMRTVVSVYEGENTTARHIHVNHGKDIEEAIEPLHELLHQDNDLRSKFSTRYLAIKLIEGDSDVVQLMPHFNNATAIQDMVSRSRKHILEETKQDAETAIMDAKYGYIHGALREADFHEGRNEDTYRITHLLDRVITHKFVGFPLFFLILFLMFETTFILGQYPMDWIEASIQWLSQWIGSTMPDGMLKDLVVDGAIAGVGSVIVFMPQILILYAFISFMEDSGYMARAAFIMDKIMHKMGLHGKSFIPLIMGFGCNVPAVMATRTIESRRSRLVTMLILPFMSCSARLPIYVMMVGTFFAARYQAWVMLSLYVVGILMAALVSRLFTRFLFKGEDTPFVMELPPYRFPTAKAIFRHTWEKGKQYLRKMGGIILVSSIVVWALGYFPHDSELTELEQQEQSYIGIVGKTIEPLFTPMGFDWRLDVGIISGIGAKEIVASTIGVLYGDHLMPGTMPPLVAYSFLLFVLLYFPCLATIAAIRQESGSWRWALFAALYTTLIAWVASAVVFQVGMLLIA